MRKTIIVPEREFFDEEACEFIKTKRQELTLIHSLVSISKWEAIWKKSYISEGPKTTEELISYYKCMTITQRVDPLVYLSLTEENIKEITEYINDPMTATTFAEKPEPPSRKKITAEEIYCWMFMYGVPKEFEKWHLNRLIALLKVCSITMGGESKKMSTNDRRALNAARRAQMKSRG